MLRFAALLLALPLAACGLVDDCSFSLEETEDPAASVTADMAGAGDTLAVVFVQAYDPVLDVSVRAGVERAPSRSSGDALVLRYGARAETFGGATPALAAAAVDGTVYVFVERALGLFREACSPPLETVEVRVEQVEVPAGVSAVSVSVVDLDGLPEGVLDALRQRAGRDATFA